MLPYFYTLLIPLLPLTGFLLAGLGGRKVPRAAGLLCVSVSFVLMLICLFTAWQYFMVTGPVNGTYPTVTVFKTPWLQFSTSMSIEMALMLDPLSVMMLMVVSVVSFMVNLFSLEYMRGEERFHIYYAFLSLFTFSMLGLVLSANIFQVYMFWELVGLSSYLLIGFYYNRPSAVAAAKKAFIVTRFADLGFLIGILIVSYYAGTLDFRLLIERLSASTTQLSAISSASALGVSMLDWGLVLIFIGGAGKSAMFPLHIWLPDAMEGPTPVSALIHAATMVVAGVFLVARLFPIYSLSGSGVLELVTYTGLFSAFFAAIIACAQTDIKRVLAYSTMSQIGYMIFALGLSGYGAHGQGYTAALFHLFTHAFFKSLLFLAAGVVIHLVHNNDMSAMGGLRRVLPVTHVAFLIGCLAIAGIPPFSGFFSKEAILHAAFEHGIFGYSVALVTAALTAFYMFRLFFMIFWNRPASPGTHPHEGGWLMKIPLVCLALGATFAGFLPFSSFVSSDGRPTAMEFSIRFSLVPVAVSLAGIIVAAILYRKANDRPANIAASFGGFYAAAKSKFYIDEVYRFITTKIIFAGFGRCAAWIDKNIVDNAVNMTAKITAKISTSIRGWQSGRIQRYTLYFFAGILVLLLWLIWFPPSVPK